MSETVRLITFAHFRGLPANEFTLKGKSLVLLGTNGKGKSALVDGIELFSRGKSHVSQVSGQAASRTTTRLRTSRQVEIQGWFWLLALRMERSLESSPRARRRSPTGRQSKTFSHCTRRLMGLFSVVRRSWTSCVIKMQTGTRNSFSSLASPRWIGSNAVLSRLNAKRTQQPIERRSPIKQSSQCSMRDPASVHKDFGQGLGLLQGSA